MIINKERFNMKKLKELLNGIKKPSKIRKIQLFNKVLMNKRKLKY